MKAKRLIEILQKVSPNNNTSCTLILKEAMTDENKV